MPQDQARFADDWFNRWPQTDSYLATDGNVARIPLRLTSTNLVLYGRADYAQALKDFDHEDYLPVTVGGSVPVQIWFNNFVDTDCGPFDRVNPYTETWFSFPVTRKPDQLELPYENPFSLNVDHPQALNWTHRVLCGPDSAGDESGARSAIDSGREVWGFPKHPAIADLKFDYVGDDTVKFTGALHGRKAIAVSARIPEKIEGHVTVPVEAESPADACLTPKQNPLKPGYIPKQTRYGLAMAATMHFAPWNPETDKLEIFGEEDHYSGPLKDWGFTPELKMHTTDFKVVARKPSGWGA